jgi:hypothetical protein
MTIRTVAALVSAAIVLAVAAAASASIAVYQSNKDLALKSDEVVVGEVKARSSIVDEKTRTPYTLTTVAVKEWVKGGAGEKEITVRQMGGKVDDKVMVVTGDARMEVGDEVVLFLRKGDGVRFLYAMAQAKFAIIRDPITGQKVVQREARDLAVGEINKDGKFEFMQAPQPIKPLTLKDFLTEIKDYIAGRK